MFTVETWLCLGMKSNNSVDSTIWNTLHGGLWRGEVQDRDETDPWYLPKILVFLTKPQVTGL